MYTDPNHLDLDRVGSALEDLVETLEDGKNGFSQVADKLTATGRTDLAGKMREYAKQREQFSGELRSVAVSEGVRIQEQGSLAGALHRGWISLKDALVSDDVQAVLNSAEAGEDHAVSEYTDALEIDLPEAVRNVVARQATAVEAAHDEVRRLRDNHGV